MSSINIKLAIRSIRKNKVHAAISIVGLGIGLGSIMILTLLYIHDTSFDRFIPEYQNVYRITRGETCQTSYPLADLLKEDSPMVESSFRYYQKDEVEIKKSPVEQMKGEHFAFADETIFKVLGIDMQTGVPARSISEIAISENSAKKFFPHQDALGKELLICINEDFFPMTICGVYNNFPSNSTIAPEFIAHIELTGEALGFSKKMFGEFNADYDQFKNWNHSLFYTYVRLTPNANSKELAQFMQKYQILTSNEKRREIAFALQPVKDIYLKSNELVDSYFSRLGNAKDLKYYLSLSSMILLIAIINYVFLNKAKTDTKLKEIGSQKALGASVTLLRKQLVIESNITAFISMIPAIFVIIAGIPFINETLNQSIDINVFFLWKTWVVLIGIVLLTGTLTGLIIARGAVNIPSVLLLKGKKTNLPKPTFWKNAVLSVHFTIFIVLLVSVFTLNKQLKYVLTNFKGIKPDNVMVYELNSNELSKKFQVIKNEVDQLPGVIASAGSSFIPPFNNFLPLRLADSTGEKIRFDGLIVGKGMLDLLGIELIDGESFGEYSSDKTNIIFNESAAKQYNLKAGELFNGFYVSGIVKDFNAHSLRDLIQPMAIIQQHPEKMRLFVIKTDGANNAAIFNSVNALLRKMSPNKFVNSYLLTDQINQFYTQEQNQTKIISSFSILAIILSVMGLLGMTLITINRKTKEIGVRKVNGAKVTEILMLLNSDFLRWVAIAFVLAAPIAYYALNKWLENFAYKTTLSWWIFALAGLMALGIALLTVSWQSWRAATRNPIEALRYE